VTIEHLWLSIIVKWIRFKTKIHEHVRWEKCFSLQISEMQVRATTCNQEPTVMKLSNIFSYQKTPLALPSIGHKNCINILPPTVKSSSFSAQPSPRHEVLGENKWKH
jgi:hypothetical protein